MVLVKNNSCYFG